MAQSINLASLPELLLECIICRENLLDPVSLTCCGQSVCASCPVSLRNCPSCRHPLKINRGRPNIVLRELLDRLYDREWLANERVAREKRALEGMRIKRIEEDYNDSYRNDQLNDAISSNLEPKGISFDLEGTLSNLDMFNQLLPGQSPVTRAELLYHIDRNCPDWDRVRVGTRLFSVEVSAAGVFNQLTEHPLLELANQDRSKLLPLACICLSALKSSAAASQRFVNMNYELFGLTESVSMDKESLASFSHLLQDKDVSAERPKKIRSRAVRRRAARAGRGPRRVESFSDEEDEDLVEDIDSRQESDEM